MCQAQLLQILLSILFLQVMNRTIPPAFNKSGFVIPIPIAWIGCTDNIKARTINWVVKVFKICLCIYLFINILFYFFKRNKWYRWL